MPCLDSHNVIFICFCDVFLHKKAFECILNPFLISFACFTTHVFAKTVNFLETTQLQTLFVFFLIRFSYTVILPLTFLT